MTVMAKPEQTNARTMVSAPALSPATIAKPDLISVEQAKAMDVAGMTDLFKAHLNPGQLHFMKLLGFHKIKIERAEGMFYIDQNGRKPAGINIISSYTKMDPAVVGKIVLLRFPQSVDVKGIEETARLMVKYGLLKSMPDMQSVIYSPKP